MYTLASIVVLSPIMAGPRIRATCLMMESSPMDTLPCMELLSSTVPFICGFSSSRTSLLASRMSSGAPVSFHYPLTNLWPTLYPFSIRSCMASVILSSPLQDGLSRLIISKIVGLRK